MSPDATPSFLARLRRFTSLNVGQQVALMALSLVATPVLYHRLGETAYGVLAIVNLLAAQLAILEFGFGHATIRWIAQCRARGDDTGLARTLGTSIWVFLATSVVGGGVLVLAAEPLVAGFFQVPPDARSTAVAAVRIGGLFFVASVLGNLASAVWQGIQRFGALNLIAGVASAAQVLGSLVLVLAGYRVVAVVIWSTVLGLLTLLAHVHWLSRALPALEGVLRPHRPTFREMGRFGFLLMLAGALNQVFQSGGPIVLGHFVAVGALPLFTVPLGLWQRLTRLTYGLAGALFPLVSELKGRQDDGTLDRLFVSGTRSLLVFGAVLMAPAVLVAGPFLHAWMGADFAAGAGRPLELLFVSFAVSLATVPSTEIARGTGRPGHLVAFTAILAALTLVGVAVLAPRWGATGAGAAFLTAHVAGLAYLVAAVGGPAARRVPTLPVVAFLLSASTTTCVLLVATASPWVRLAEATLLGLALLGSAVGWVLNDEERATLRRAVRHP